MRLDASDRRSDGASAGIRTQALASPRANTSASTVSLQELQIPYTAKPADADVEKAEIAAELSKRLQFLRIEAEVDQIAFSDASLSDFRALMRDLAPCSRPYLFLNDSGNLRLVWKNESREQVALEFLGGGMIQFVIFRQRKAAPTITRVAGIDAAAKILDHIKAAGAEELLRECRG